MSTAQLRNWCFTLNNPPEDFSLPTLCKDYSVRYCIVQLERGESGTLHLQGYVEFVKPRRLSELIKWLPRAHFERRLGSRDQAREYCRKQDATYVAGPWHWPSEDAFGDSVKPGSRTDLESAVMALAQGASVREVAMEHSVVYVKFFKGLERLACQLLAPPSFREVASYYITGATGVGKSAFVYETFGYEQVFALPSKHPLWFDGYVGQHVLLIDEYSGTPDREALLRLLDGHPLDVPVKGGFVRASWRWVFLLSNYDYTEGFDDALLRRFGAKSVERLGLGRELVGFDAGAQPRVVRFRGSRGSYVFDLDSGFISGKQPGDVVHGWSGFVHDGRRGDARAASVARQDLRQDVGQASPLQRGPDQGGVINSLQQLPGFMVASVGIDGYCAIVK